MTPETAPAVAAAALYAGLNALLLVALGLHVVRVRVAEKIMMGDAGNPRLIRAIRGQANFVEYVPLALILMFATAMLGAPAFAVHLMGAVLTVGRALHAWHFTRDDAPAWQRGGGAMMTLAVVGVGGLGVVGHALTML